MRYFNLKSFQKHLKSAAPHNLCRVYLILSGDDYERRKILESILSHLVSPDSFPAYFRGSELILKDFFDALQSLPLLGGEPIVVLDECEKVGKKDLQAISSLLPSLSFGFLLLASRSKTVLGSYVEKEGVVLDLTEEKPWDQRKRFIEQLQERVESAGKRLSPDAAELLLERSDPDIAFLESEIDKCISYAGERQIITVQDILSISIGNKTATLWQIAEEMIWEGNSPSWDLNQLPALIFALRSQLHLGLVLSTLSHGKHPPEKWKPYLPKIWPKTLEKRTSQVASINPSFFKKGLETLFEMELLSRTSSNQTRALLDLFLIRLKRDKTTSTP